MMPLYILLIIFLCALSLMVQEIFLYQKTQSQHHRTYYQSFLLMCLTIPLMYLLSRKSSCVRFNFYYLFLAALVIMNITIIFLGLSKASRTGKKPIK